MTDDNREKQLPVTQAPKDPSGVRVDKINKLLDSEIEKIFSDLDIVSSDLDSLMAILKDRMIESTEASFPIALARLGELRMDAIKKRIDILKTLVTDKGSELQSKKKRDTGDLDSILSGAGIGMVLGAKLGQSNYNPPPVIVPSEDVEFETVNIDETLIVETETLNPGNVLKESDISGLLGSD